jgi:hypothetical protein
MRTGAKYGRPGAGRGHRGSPDPDFTRAEPVTYMMDVVLDSIDDPARKVPQAITKLVDWTRTTTRSREQRKPSPPLLMFVWGGRHWGPVHITKLKVEHTLFDAQGEPVRAKVNLRLTQVGTEPGRTNPTSGGVPVAGRCCSRAPTGSSRSRSASTATPRCGAPWPTPTASTTPPGWRAGGPAAAAHL